MDVEEGTHRAAGSDRPYGGCVRVREEADETSEPASKPKGFICLLFIFPRRAVVGFLPVDGDEEAVLIVLVQVGLD